MAFFNIAKVSTKQSV